MGNATCKGPECTRDAGPRTGLCPAHSRQKLRNGTLKPLGKPGLPAHVLRHKAMPEVERFWPKVEKTPKCWNWLGAKVPEGYGTFRAEGRTVRAHRWSWEHVNGAIPAGMLLDHTCHNRACVNPAHLRLATNKQNMENVRSGYRSGASGIRGVRWDKRRNRWTTLVTHHGVNYTAGAFTNSEDAEAAIIKLRNQLYTHNDADRVPR